MTIWDVRLVHYSEVRGVRISEVEMYGVLRLSAGGTQIFRCREVVRSSECPLLEVPLYINADTEALTANLYLPSEQLLFLCHFIFSQLT